MLQDGSKTIFKTVRRLVLLRNAYFYKIVITVLIMSILKLATHKEKIAIPSIELKKSKKKDNVKKTSMSTK